MNIACVDNMSDRNRRIGGAIVGGAVGTAVPALTLYDSFRKVHKNDAIMTSNVLQKLMPNVDTFENTMNNVGNILKETGLDKKGVKVTAFADTPEMNKQLKNIIDANVKPSNALNRRLNNNYFNIFKYGGNAAYFSETKDVVIHSKNTYSSVYHELGHAMNANGNIFTKALQQARVLTPFGISVVAPIALAVGIFHKVDETKPAEAKSKKEKTLDFIANNAGKLTLASYMPLVAEEALASYRGINQAKKYVTKGVLSGLKKNYITALGTYVGMALTVTGLTALGVKIAQHNMKPKKTKELAS